MIRSQSNLQSDDSSNALKTWKWLRSYSNFVYKYPWIVILISMSIVVGLSTWLLLMGLEISANMTYYRWDGDDITEKWDSYLTATKKTYSTSFEKASSISTILKQHWRTQSGLIVYERKDGNVIDIPIIQKMWRTEEKLLSFQGYPDHCFAMNSTDPFDVYVENQCSTFGSLATYLKMVMYLRMNDPQPENISNIDILITLCIPTLIDMVFGKDFNGTGPSSHYMRTSLPLGLPLEGYINRNDRIDEQENTFADWGVEWIKPIQELNDEKPMGLNSYITVPYALDKLISQFVMKQVLLLIGSFGFLFVIAIIYMRSFFVSIFGILTLFLAIPCAVSFQYGIINIRHFDALNSAGVFLVCCIGANAIFVIYDIFKKIKLISGYSNEERLAYTCQRSFISIGTTFLTASVPFLIILSSGVRLMKYYGIFCFLQIFFMFLIIFTLFMGFLAIWAKHFESKSFFCRKVTDIDTNPLHPHDLSTISFSNSDGQEYQTNEYPYRSPISCFFHRPIFKVYASGIDFSACSKYEKFFHNYVCSVIYFYRLPIIILMLILTIVMGVFSFEMPGQSMFQFLGNDHTLQRGYYLMSNVFRTSIQDFSFIYVWGLGPQLKKKWTNKLKPDDYGDLVLTGIDIKNTEIQQYISDMCDAMEEADFIDSSGDIVCPIRMLKSYAKSIGQTFPVPRENFTDSFMSGYQEYLSNQFLSEADSMFLGTLKKNTIGFSYDNDSLVYIAIKGSMKMPDTLDSSSITPIYNDALDFAESVIEPNTPQGLEPGFMTSYGWLAMVYENKVPKQALFDVFLSICVSSFVICITTLSFSYTFFYAYSMTSTIFTVIGILYFCGWKIGVNEATMISVLTGFCTNFIIQPTLNIVHDHSQISKFGKIQYSLTTSCQSISAAFLTTFFAAVFLLPSEFLLFPAFGTYFILCGAFGLIYGLFVFPALYAWFGPEYNDNIVKLCKNHKDDIPFSTNDSTSRT